MEVHHRSIPGLYECGAFVSLITDVDQSNDTLFPVNIYACDPLSGQYIIGSGASADFSSFTEAVDALVSCGVGGNVVFSVDTGTYYEQIVIPEISGASDTSTITFRSATSDSTDVILTWGASSTTDNYIVLLDGADYVKFKFITIKAQGATYGYVVQFDNGANYNEFTNNIIETTAGTGTSLAGFDNPLKSIQGLIR